MNPAPQHLRTFMVTCATANRRRLFQVTDTAELMLDTLQTYRLQGRYSLHGFVIMPDHIHLLLTPAPAISLEKAIQYIKGGFSFRLKSKLDVWTQGRFDKRIADPGAYQACLTYIHQNPVQAGMVQRAEAFPFSSAHPAQGRDPAPVWLERRTRAEAPSFGSISSAG